MPKKQPLAPLKKWAIGAGISIIVIPALTFSWRNITSIWASPDKLSSVEKKILSHDEVQAKLGLLVLEQSARIERNEQLDEMRAQNAKEQLQLISDIKKYKK